MARTGRPPKPTEVKRRLGNPGKRRLPDPATVVALPAAARTPDPPVDLADHGHRLWHMVWQAGAVWISPDADRAAVEEACRLVDDLAAARRRYRATGEPADGRLVAAFTRAVSDTLSTLGFTPTARARLGVAEVRHASALAQLVARRENRHDPPDAPG